MLLGVAAAAAAVLGLHLVRTDLPPVGSRLSAYAVGPYGWLMAVAFVALGLSAFGLSVVLLTSHHGWVARLAGVTAAAAGVGLIVSAMFPTGVSASAEVVHSQASAFATVGLTVVAGVSSLLLDAGKDRRTLQLLAGAAVLLAVVSPVLHHSRFTGLVQRLLWLVLALWLAVAARRLSAPATSR